jgi:hypothetical protein
MPQACSSLIRKDFHGESFRNAKDLGSHLLGGLSLCFAVHLDAVIVYAP